VLGPESDRDEDDRERERDEEHHVARIGRVQ
jgi:hypothetical protein